MAAKPKPTKSPNHTNTNKKISESPKNPKSKKPSTGTNSKGGEKSRKKSGPRLPNALRRQIDAATRRHDDEEVFDSEEEFMGRGDGDAYDYEEETAEEESKKNRRYDPVDNYEFELPDNFKDEEVPSDEEDINDESHGRLLQAITGMPSVAFERKNAPKPSTITEPYPESEYNPTRDVLDGTRKISVEDLMAPLIHSSEYSKLRKRMLHIERRENFAQVPKVEKDKIERKAVYEFSKKDMTKWEGVVKRNREAPTVFFDENTDVGFSTVGAIASEFKPRTDFEKAMASLLKDSEVMEAHNKDGARLLELNKVSIEDVKDRLNRNAKMRHLLFRHELKAKHIKKIKSKMYHRLKKKDKLKTAVLDMEADPESAKELARKQEFKRAEERMTLRHKNKSKWAKRILERGLDAQDEGTRAAITDQLHQHELLTRKMNSLKDDSSSRDESSEYDEDLDGSDEDGASRLLEKAKKKTIALVDDEDEKPLSGVMSLPFMVRGMKKKKEAVIEEAKVAIDEYESLMNPQKDRGRRSGQQEHVPSGRLVFGGDRKQVPAPTAEPPRSDPGNLHSDSEDEIETSEHVSMINEKSNGLAKDVDVDLDALREECERAHDSVFKSIDDVIKDPNPKTTYDVAIFADGSWKKMKSGDEQHAPWSGNNADVVEPNFAAQDEKEADDGSDAESEGAMIDRILTSETKQSYELPSQEELIWRAFAADDVEEDFGKAKQEVLDEENPAPEEPKLIPGWGQWTDVQQKRGVPSWMIKEHDDAQKKRDEALKKRKDAHLKNVIISEKVDKKAEKLFSQTLPYPFTSKEVFEQSMRIPIGPEFNPASAFRALSRPEVVKTPGIIIKPIQYQEVDPHERADDEKSGDKRQWKKGKGAGNKTSNGTKRR